MFHKCTQQRELLGSVASSVANSSCVHRYEYISKMTTSNNEYKYVSLQSMHTKPQYTIQHCNTPAIHRKTLQYIVKHSNTPAMYRKTLQYIVKHCNTP